MARRLTGLLRLLSSSDPPDPAAGDLWYDPTRRQYRGHDGTSELPIGPSFFGLAVSAPVTGDYNVAPSIGSIGTRVLPLNQLNAVPFAVARRMSIDQIVVEVTTAGATGAVLRVGVYAAHADTFRPAALLRDLGTLAATTTGNKLFTVSPALVLDPGIYWPVVVAQGAASTVRGVAGLHPFVSTLNVNPSAAWNGYGMNSVTGALPATYAVGVNVQAPRVDLRAA